MTRSRRRLPLSGEGRGRAEHDHLPLQRVPGEEDRHRRVPRQRLPLPRIPVREEPQRTVVVDSAQQYGPRSRPVLGIHCRDDHRVRFGEVRGILQPPLEEREGGCRQRGVVELVERVVEAVGEGVLGHRAVLRSVAGGTIVCARSPAAARSPRGTIRARTRARVVPQETAVRGRRNQSPAIPADRTTKYTRSPPQPPRAPPRSRTSRCAGGSGRIRPDGSRARAPSLLCSDSCDPVDISIRSPALLHGRKATLASPTCGCQHLAAADVNPPLHRCASRGIGRRRLVTFAWPCDPHERTPVSLFSPTTVGSIGVRNRVSLAPMTRLRASATAFPARSSRSTTSSAPASASSSPRACSRAPSRRRTPPARNRHRRAGRRLGEGRGCRARRRRSGVHAAHERRTRHPHRHHRHRPHRRPLGDRDRGRHPPRRRLEGRLPRAPRPRDRGARHRPRRVREGRPSGCGCRHRRRRAALGERLPAARVPLPRLQPAHRRLRRIARGPRPLRHRGRPGRRRRDRRRPRRHPHLPAHNIQDVWEKDDAETRATYEALIDGLARWASRT